MSYDITKSYKKKEVNITFILFSQFEGPILVLHSMMVDPNASIKKTGGTDLAVVQGEILEVIQVTSDKKALCRNKQGKCM